MNEQTQTAFTADDGGEQGSDQSGDAQSTATGLPGTTPTLFQRLTGLFRPRNGTSIRDDLADALADSIHHAEAFSPGERAMLNNILRLRELRVEDVMIPRADIEAVETSTKLGDLLAQFERSGHSRMPVYGETLDDPRGMVHLRDVVGHITRTARAKRTRSKKPVNGNGNGNGNSQAAVQAAAADLSRVDLGKTIGELGLMRPLLFVPPSMLASDLMARMQAGRIQMALVIDEYGGTDGLVSLEDVVEMVVGDIEDEHDEDEPMITRTAEGTFIVDAKAEIDEVAAMIGESFKAGEHAEDVDTIGGMIFNTLGRVPARGEVVQAVPGFEFQVLDADPRRVKRVRIIQGRGGERRRRAIRSGEALAEPAEG